MDAGCGICSLIQAALGFVLGWGLRAHCKLEVDVDSAPEPFMTRLIRVFTG